MTTSAPDFLCTLNSRPDAVGQDVGDHEAEVVPGLGVVAARGCPGRPPAGARPSTEYASDSAAVSSPDFASPSAASPSAALLGLLLDRLAAALGLEVLGGRGGDDVDDQQLGIGDQRDAVGQLDLRRR